MKLFLASEGSDPRTTKKLENYVGGWSGKKVIYIPTARNGSNQFGTWKDSSTWKFLKSTGMEIEAVQLENYKDFIDPKIFEDADILWVSGGACGYLMYWIIRTGLDKMLPKILKKTLYVGSSAGSMITSPTLKIADWFIGETERGASYLPGLGLTDFDFYPHYDENLKSEIISKYKGNKMYLVRDGDALIYEDNKVIVLGEENIIAK